MEDIGNAELRMQRVTSLKAQAYAKRATSLATEGKIADAEKDLKEAEALGALDGDLSSARQLLAAAYVTQAEAAVARSDVAGIRAACDSAEQYRKAATFSNRDDFLNSKENLNRLRAAAFKAEGEQKEKSGDLSGAVAALDEAVKLDSNLGLRTERAVLHVKIGEQAAAKQDYQTATTELKAAVTLDKSASGAVELAATVAEPVMAAFESDASAANQAAAIDAVKAIESVDPQYSGLPVRRGRLSATVIKRGEALVATDLDSSLADYEQALSLGASAADVASLKRSVVSALQTRCLASLAAQDVAKGLADYAALMELDSQAASSLVADFEKCPRVY